MQVRVLLWFLLVVTAVLASCVLVPLGLQAAEIWRIRNGPGLASATFRLEPGWTGTWDPVWPANFEWQHRAELWIETEPPWTDPESFAVRVAAQPVEACRPCGEFLGSPGKWFGEGLAYLPDELRRAQEFDDRWRSARCMENVGAVRIDWSVESVSPDFAGASARLVLRFPERHAGTLWEDLHALAGFALPAALLLASCAVIAALALLFGRKRVRVAS